MVIIAALIGGAVNSIAGGGTLLTFPALVALGVPPINANATSTIALWPGSLGSMWGYRWELKGARLWALGFAIPSVLGGATGAWLLLRTPAERFSVIVPWLVLGATFLFMAQRPVLAWFAREPRIDAAGGAPRSAADDIGGQYVPSAERDLLLTSRHPPIAILLYQYLVAVYGGYFGAGAGILMLAALGFMGLSNIHRMNGLKNWGGLCMNAVAATMFAFSSLVHWPVGVAMAAGAMSGGYIGSRAAQRVSQKLVRGAVVAIGLVSGVLLFFA